MKMNIGQDENGDLPSYDPPKRGEKKGASQESVLTRATGSSFNVSSYLSKNIVSVETETEQIKLEVLKIPVTQEFYHAYKREKKFSVDNPCFPADEICWQEAIEFCNWVSKMDNKDPCYTKYEDEQTGKSCWTCDDSKNGYRLPKKTEWFFVAQGGILKSNFKFSGSSNIGKVAWYNGNSKGCLQEVEKKEPNKLGLYDLSGNVWEFCWDTYDCSADRIACGGSAQSSEGLCEIRPENVEHFKEGEPSPFVGFRLFRYNLSKEN